ncbi:Uma2 family endonuclease [Nocardia pseudobrasiliensis]|uniref:Uma2 family endonuclease n=1 Tax=Nocardia pseudobrasiliensis TaxID=45979 RepID=A0A370I942_9NOCA|nr:Uma2 family endonuclease [Nocardia pseudobrasiliensis]RDI67246.1 Uma2 family endonuclease [Nocardia pseudobrasiliensis]
MSIVTQWPDHLLTLADWDGLPEDSSRRFELVEGVLGVTPRPILRHQSAGWRLAGQLEPQLPPELYVVTEAELLIDAEGPATVSVPDIMAVRGDLMDDDLARATAADVPLAVEILSPGTRRTDRVTKFAEAGIDHYWLLDLDEPITLTAYRLVDGEYELVGEHTGKARLVLFDRPVIVDLPSLTRHR